MTHHHRLLFGAAGFVLGGLCWVAAGRADDDSVRARTPARPDNARKLSKAAGEARTVAAQVDALIAAKWVEAKVQPARPADDAEFLRRLYLDLVGKIPTAAEAREYLEDTSPDKQVRLVEMLLESPAYLTHATETYRSMLLPEADTDGQIRALTPTFEAWLRKKVAEDAGYDKIAREVLTVRLGGQGRRGGNAYDPRAEPSPLAYYFAKDAKPENLAAGAARTFMGIRLECAQCHNHPFDQWKREEFWGLAAFFAGVSRQGKDENFGSIRELANRREVVIPDTNKVVKAAFLDGKKLQDARRVSGRDLLADWLIAADNPYFARAAVNRVWARFFGTGIVDPVDDLRADNPPSHPEVLDLLAREFRSHGYDLKFLIRTITATKVYGLTSAVGRSETAPPHLFAAMPVRTLSPGQLFETLAQATGFREGSRGPMYYEGASRERFVELFTNRDEKPTEGETTILQALALMNGPLMASVTSVDSSDALAAVVEAPYLDTPGRIETLYLAALTRRPRPDELERLVTYVDHGSSPAEKAKALADVFWALLNTPEFRFNH
jgi:Protein of unknown function (DUF1553)/Protein of unknown function (DUF1549)